MIKSRAAVAFEKAKPLTLVELDVAAPKAGEVLVRIVATGVCHTDAYTLSGADPEGLFPTVLGQRSSALPAGGRNRHRKPWSGIGYRVLRRQW